jgi:hypothetical protein
MIDRATMVPTFGSGWAQTLAVYHYQTTIQHSLGGKILVILSRVLPSRCRIAAGIVEPREGRVGVGEKGTRLGKLDHLAMVQDDDLVKVMECVQPVYD